MLPQLIPDNFPEKTNTQDKSTLAQFPIAIPLEKVRKPLSILTFSGGIEMEHWLEIVNKLHETEANNKHIKTNQLMTLTSVLIHNMLITFIS